MKLEEHIGRAIVIAPLIHVTTCTIYLFGLSSGFGSTLYSLLTVSDFFQVTIGGMINIYGMAIVVPLIIALYWQGRRAIIAETKDAKSLRVQLRIDELTLKSVVYIALFRVSYDVLLFGAGIEASFALTLLAMSCATSVGIFVAATQIFMVDRARVLVAIGAIIFGTTVFGQGYDTGDFMRRGPYAYFNAKSMRCGNHAVLFAAGGRFVTVTPDGRRSVVDEQCQLRFRFPVTKPLSDTTLMDHLRKQFGGLYERYFRTPESPEKPKSMPDQMPATSKSMHL